MAEPLSASGSPKHPSRARLSGAVPGNGWPGRVDGEPYHSRGRALPESGADLRWIQAMLGYRSVESTQIYTQVSIRALQAVHGSTHPAECIKSEHDRDANNEYD